MHKKETLIKNQRGIASMVIVILIMTLLSLIVLAMTKNANREQRQALDRQLNSQAFYAAESGVNDAKDYYAAHANDPVAANRAPEQKSKCDNSETGATVGNQFPEHSSQVGANVNTYSCVLYDAAPDSLIFSDISTDNATLMPIEDEDQGAIQSMTFTWKRPNNPNYTFTGCPNSGFPKQLTNCDAGMLRIELIDPSAGSRSDFITKNFLAFVSPRPNPTSSPANPAYNNGWGTNNQGVVWRGGCTGGINGECKITINGINRNKLMLHIRSLYNDNEVKVTAIATNPVTGDPKPAEFKDAQMMIDSTGKAADILKRIQVRAPLNKYGNGVYPEFAVQTTESICKLLQIIPAGIPGVQSTNGGCNLSP